MVTRPLACKFLSMGMNGYSVRPKNKPSPGLRRVTVLWAAPTWPALIGWPNSWTAPGAWRAWRKWWIAGSIRPACVLRSAGNNSNVRAFTTPIPATNWNTAAIFCSKAAGNWSAVYQGLIDRTRRLLDVPRLKTIFGRKRRPRKTSARDGRLEKIIDRSVYDLTVFKLHFGKLTLKMYDKGDRVLRVEIIVNNIEQLRCGKRLEKLPGMLERLQAMVVAFLGVVQAAHLSFVDGQQLDALAAPSVRGVRRTAGVDLQKPRMRAVAQAVIALAAQPEGFTAADLAERVQTQQGRAMVGYGDRKASYDLRKMRGKSLVERVGKTRRYWVRRPGIRTLAALLILREQVIKPVLAAVCRPKRGRPPKNLHPLNVHYQKLKVEMLATLKTLKLAA